MINKAELALKMKEELSGREIIPNEFFPVLVSIEDSKILFKPTDYTNNQIYYLPIGPENYFFLLELMQALYKVVLDLDVLSREKLQSSTVVFDRGGCEMPSFDVEFEVFCSCGEGLCNQSETRTSRNRNTLQVVVEPCQRCLDRIKNEGYQNGYDDGREV
jgi:hypothetical protein